MSERILWRATADFRQYVPEVCLNAQGIEVGMMMCEDLVEGRWEPFYSDCSPARARQIQAEVAAR